MNDCRSADACHPCLDQITVASARYQLTNCLFPALALTGCRTDAHVNVRAQPLSPRQVNAHVPQTSTQLNLLTIDKYIRYVCTHEYSSSKNALQLAVTPEPIPDKELADHTLPWSSSRFPYPSSRLPSSSSSFAREVLLPERNWALSPCADLLRGMFSMYIPGIRQVHVALFGVLKCTKKSHALLGHTVSVGPGLSAIDSPCPGCVGLLPTGFRGPQRGSQRHGISVQLLSVGVLFLQARTTLSGPV